MNDDGPCRCARRLAILAMSLTSTIVLSVAPAIAQTPADPSEEARGRVGVLRYNPTVDLTVGADTNVFNRPDNPSADFTVALTPHLDTWLRLGRARASGRTTVGLIYFHQFASERSVNFRQEVLFEVPAPRIRPYVSGVLLTSRERLNFEIDARARRLETLGTAGLDVHVTPKTTIGVVATRARVDFDSSAEFLEVELREVLNRTVTTAGAVIRRALTPYTTLALVADRQHERFEFSPFRNSRSVRVLPGVEFNRFALISGRGAVGYRRFDAESELIPDYAGLVASADLGYTLRGVTRFNVLVERDVAYSVDVGYPYYLITSYTGSVLHQVSERWQLGATVGRHHLTYEALRPINLVVPLPPRLVDGEPVDTIWQLGGRIGHRVGPDTMVGLTVQQFRRSSAFNLRDYSGLRVAAELTYGRPRP